jgi:hypothetical protein
MGNPAAVEEEEGTGGLSGSYPFPSSIPVEEDEDDNESMKFTAMSYPV